MTEHRHAAVLRAIADGREVQFEDPLAKVLWINASMLGLNSVTPLTHPHLNWRVAPLAWQEALRQAVREGKVVEFRTLTCGGEWLRSNLNDLPDRFDFDVSAADRYRIRPEPKPDRVRDKWLYEIGIDDVLIPIAQFRIVHDGKTGKLKSAEVLP